MARRLRLRQQGGVDVCQRGMAIHLRLAGAEQVEVGTMQDQQFSHGRSDGRAAVCANPAILSRSPKLLAF
jgi:hypothetical protein